MHMNLFLEFLLYRPCHLHKCLFDICRVLCGSLQENKVKGIGELFCLLICDLALIEQIALVTYQQFVYILTSISIYLLQPLLNVVESFEVCNIINNNNSMCTTVVAGCNCSEALLTGLII